MISWACRYQGLLALMAVLSIFFYGFRSYFFLQGVKKIDTVFIPKQLNRPVVFFNFYFNPL